MSKATSLGFVSYGIIKAELNSSWIPEPKSTITPFVAFWSTVKESSSKPSPPSNNPETWDVVLTLISNWSSCEPREAPSFISLTFTVTVLVLLNSPSDAITSKLYEDLVS